ncbi:Vesicle coat protein involved in Golgi to plasma membrane transport [Trypanosoma brucei equiperdum]|uniref:Vesicle coat protein involved in Golgi to plasma membrane transport n=1 Tax=Trypanosoma brucei equiperdum TaxID=630700 RepID=A0A3L6LBA2_9TRYP|nr:Vesicle coat protein involved in Golgi to plasma membrane transport [Trypanosoma brucei equiperdum]
MQTVWNVPAVILGEFDAIEGPKDLHVTEYYEYQEMNSFDAQMPQLSAFHGKALFSAHSISGSLRPHSKQKMRELVARVLDSNESNEESVVMSDPDAGGVSGIAFCLGDILARGESRRFCVIITHPRSDELIRRWPVLSCFMRILLEGWVDVTERRLASEYSTFPDLERRREEARKRPMRPLMSLLAEDDEAEADAFRRTHNFFECVLLALFGRTPLIPEEPTCETAVLNAVKQYLEMKLPLVETIDVDVGWPPEIGRCVSLGDSRVVSLGPFHLLKPLSVWLLVFLEWSDTGLDETELLLSALLRGKQIVVYGADYIHCAGLAISLSQILPRSLRSVSVFSEKYRLPCESRILSFNTPVRLGTLIEMTCQTNAGVPHSDVVCVNVDDSGRIVSIHNYGACGRGSDTDKPHAYHKIGDVSRSSVVKQFTNLLRSHMFVPAAVRTCKKLQFHIEQLVVETVLRGRLYAELFQEGATRITNKDSLCSGKRCTSYRHSRPIWHRLFDFFLGDYCLPSSRLASVESSCNANFFSGDTGAVFVDSGGRVEPNSMVNSSYDHDALIFLGSA